MARLEPEGQDDMNAEASVKTERTPRGVSKAEGMAADFVAVRMKVWWRDSTVTICAATERMAVLFTKGAAPRYLLLCQLILLLNGEKWTYAEHQYSPTPPQ